MQSNCHVLIGLSPSIYWKVGWVFLYSRHDSHCYVSTVLHKVSQNYVFSLLYSLCLLTFAQSLYLGVRTFYLYVLSFNYTKAPVLLLIAMTSSFE